MKEVLHANFDIWAWYTSHEARTPWMLQLYTFTVLASVVSELNILMWHEFYYLAFSFGLTVVLPLSLSSLSSAKSFFTDKVFLLLIRQADWFCVRLSRTLRMRQLFVW